jgi:EAL domain-containing protein (putative c-di-GMP-specific phosphodiesterase class I)
MMQTAREQRALQELGGPCTVQLARGFGYDTIAEGVEDHETLALLRSYGGDYGQGYLLGAPAPLGTR